MKAKQMNKNLELWRRLGSDSFEVYLEDRLTDCFQQYANQTERVERVKSRR